MNKLVIVIGDKVPDEIISKSKSRFKPIIFEFPESKLHPKDQIKWFNNMLDGFIKYKGTIIIKTYSDYVIREVNYNIMENKINYRSVVIIDNESISKSNKYGIESESIDEVIDDQNKRCEDSYYELKYGKDKNVDSQG